MRKTVEETDEKPTAASIDYGFLSGNVGFHMRFAAIAIYRDFTSTLDALNLTQHQHGVMQIISLNPGESQANIADVLGTDRVTMIAIIDKLEERDLISRRPSKVDRRRRELHLTNAGSELLKKANRLIRQHEARITKELGPEEVDALLIALRSIHGRQF